MQSLPQYIFETHFGKMTSLEYMEQHITMKKIQQLNWHKELELLYITNGKGGVVCDGEIVEVEKGDICAINPYSAHEVFAVSECVDFNVYIINDIFCREYGIDFEKLRFQKKICSETVKELLDTITNELKSDNDYKDTYIAGTVLRLSAELARNHVLYTMDFDKKSYVRKENINYAIGFINMHYKENITLESVAEKLSLNKSYLAREFKSFVGMTVTQYINNLRCVQAQRIIADSKGETALAEVAEQCGFENIYYFSNVFKKYVGISPSQYRKVTEK